MSQDVVDSLNVERFLDFGERSPKKVYQNDSWKDKRDERL